MHKILAYSNNKNHLSEVINLSKVNRIVPFIGSGLTSSIYPSWNNLLREMNLRIITEKDFVEYEFIDPDTGKLRSINRSMRSDIDDLINDNDYLNAAQKLYNHNKPAFASILKHIFTNDIESERIPNSINLVTDIWKGNIITSNYDRCIESSIQSKNKKYKVHIPYLVKDTSDIYRSIQTSESAIFKIHGDCMNIEDIVLPLVSYEKAYSLETLNKGPEVQNFKEIECMLSVVLNSNALLFLGSSIVHDPIYELIKMSSEKCLKIYAVLSDSYSDRTAELSDAGISVIWYPNGEHQYVEEILSYIKHGVTSSYREVKEGRNSLNKIPIIENYLKSGGEGINYLNDLYTCKRNSDEAFFIEVNQNDIVIEYDKQTNMRTVTINRVGSDYGVISSKGKNALADIVRKNSPLDKLVKIDDAIHNALKGDESKYIINSKENNLLFRWASGGAIPIVNYNNKKYIPLLYRDIAPYGWNLALGASERYFDTSGNFVSNSEEVSHPINMLYREFYEEVLVIDGHHKADLTQLKLLKYFPFKLPKHNSNMEVFAQTHLDLREHYDNLRIVKSSEFIDVKHRKTNTMLKVVNHDGSAETLTDVIVSINCLDQGIEVVKVFEFDMKNSCSIIDGEVMKSKSMNKYGMINKDVTHELIRMPVVLMSYDVLEQYFSDKLSDENSFMSNFDIYEGLDDRLPSYKVKTENDGRLKKSIFHKISADAHSDSDFIGNRFDIGRRYNILFRNDYINVGAEEKRRHRLFFEKLMINKSKEDVSKQNMFSVESRIDKHEIYTYSLEACDVFTPATAKLLNLLFSSTKQHD